MVPRQCMRKLANTNRSRVSIHLDKWYEVHKIFGIRVEGEGVVRPVKIAPHLVWTRAKIGYFINGALVPGPVRLRGRDRPLQRLFCRWVTVALPFKTSNTIDY